jgi:tetratricopeptide (TPR) repeat protein
VIAIIAEVLKIRLAKTDVQKVWKISLNTVIYVFLSFLFIYIVLQLSQNQSTWDATLPKGIDNENKNIGAAWNNMGFVLYKEGKYDEAIECYDNATNIDPDYVLAWSNKAEALNALHRNSEAELALNEAKNYQIERSAAYIPN